MSYLIFLYASYNIYNRAIKRIIHIFVFKIVRLNHWDTNNIFIFGDGLYSLYYGNGYYFDQIQLIYLLKIQKVII